ncbi:hypothetical protein KFK09_003573 [Dendrobium nobile]|uniref:NAD-dependent epimerase/dehydratase domain-containing protein n=1 Tax=Dendrobium nobile TaxID=94219 RepID=A0A8T3BY77_DENNO|nr:hypothetical protein KFK09_003573 [Dendrobium nobile]
MKLRYVMIHLQLNSILRAFAKLIVFLLFGAFLRQIRLRQKNCVDEQCNINIGVALFTHRQIVDDLAFGWSDRTTSRKKHLCSSRALLMEKLSTVCVTGATGYIGDESKVQLLKKLEGADDRLRLFEADLYDAEKFELAINGCEFVFLVATPLLHNPNSQDYINTKTSTEKEFLAYNTKGEKRRIEVVSLVCALVGGNAILEYVSGSVSVIISPLSGQRLPYKQLKLLQEMLGSVPLVHIDDVCEAHIFCIQNDIISERFMCVSQWPVMQEIVDYYELKFTSTILLKEVEGDKSVTPCNSTKLLDLGFKYKYSMEQILDGSVEYARRVGDLTDL